MLNLIELLEIYNQISPSKELGRRAIEKLQTNLISQIKKASPHFMNQCEFRPIQTGNEFEEVTNIVQYELNKKNKLKSQTGPYQLALASSSDQGITFICKYKGDQILGAISIVIDSKFGIPLEGPYKPYVQRFRRMGRQIAEITVMVQNSRALEDAKLNLSQYEKLMIFLNLLRKVMSYLKTCTNIDTVMTRISPCHEQFYKALLFRPLTGLEYYAGRDNQRYPAFFIDLNFLSQQDNGPMGKFLTLKDKQTTNQNSRKHFRFSFDDFMAAFQLTGSPA